MTPFINNFGGNEIYERDPRSINCCCKSCENRRKDLFLLPSNHQNQQQLKSEKLISIKRRSRISRIVLYWNFLSIFLCLTVLTQTVTGLDMIKENISDNNINNNNNKNNILIDDNNGSHGPDIDDPGGGGGGGKNNINSANIVVIRENPLLRHRRVVYQQKSDNSKMCHVWNRHSSTDLCNKGRWARLRLLRVLSLWSTDCEKSNVQIGELFRLEWPKIKAESDLISHTEHLKPGSEGRDCLLAAPRSEECLACFNRMDTNILMMEKAYDAFNHTLRRFDCTIAVDASSATRPFSPNGTCEDCKMWYRKWLLVQLLDIWQEAPCINWCYYAQLACPHIASSRQVDYAGQPSFFCRDLKVSKNTEDYGPRYCKCFHPCDLERTPTESQKWYETNKNRISTIRQYDFFASNEHCWARKRICDAEKLFEESAIDGISHLAKISSSTTTTSSTIIKSNVDQMLSSSQPSSSSSTSSASTTSTFFGFIHDVPADLFNQLGSWFFPNIISTSSSPPPSTSLKNSGDKKELQQQQQKQSSKKFQTSSSSLSSAKNSIDIPSSSSSAAIFLSSPSSKLLSSFIIKNNPFFETKFLFNFFKMPLSFIPFNLIIFLLFVFYLLRIF